MHVGIQHLVLSSLFWSIQAAFKPHCPSCEDQGKYVILFQARHNYFGSLNIEVIFSRGVRKSSIN